MALFAWTFNISNSANPGVYGSLTVYWQPTANINSYVQSANPQFQRPGRRFRGGLGTMGNDWRGWGTQRRNSPMPVTPGTLFRPVQTVRPHPLIRF